MWRHSYAPCDHYRAGARPVSKQETLVTTAKHLRRAREALWVLQLDHNLTRDELNRINEAFRLIDETYAAVRPELFRDVHTN